MLLENKFGVIFGVANKRSIAWATAQALSEGGERLAFTYQGERLKENVEGLTKEMRGTLIVPCDVTRPEEVAEAFNRIGEEFGRLDFMIHSIAYAPKEDLEGAFVDTSRDGFLTALEVSAYSLASLARAAVPLMTEGGSIVSMTYYGAEKVVPNYNVMGVAKAARSQHPLSRGGFGQTQHPRQLHQRRAAQHAVGARRLQHGTDAQTSRRTRAARSQR